MKLNVIFIRRSVLIGAGLISIMFGVLSERYAYEVSYRIPAQDITQELKDRTPFTRKEGPLSVSVVDGDISPSSDGKVNVRLLSDVNGSGFTGSALIDAEMRLGYQDGLVFIYDVDIDRIPVSLKRIRVSENLFEPQVWNDARLSILDTRTGPADMSSRLKMSVIDAAMPSMVEKITLRLEGRPVLDLEDHGVMGWVANDILSGIDVEDGNISLRFWVINTLTRHALIIFALLCFSSVIYRWQKYERDWVARP